MIQLDTGEDTEAEKLFFSHLSSSRPLFLGPKHSRKTNQMENKNSVGNDRKAEITHLKRHSGEKPSGRNLTVGDDSKDEK